MLSKDSHKALLRSATPPKEATYAQLLLQPLSLPDIWQDFAHNTASNLQNEGLVDSQQLGG